MTASLGSKQFGEIVFNRLRKAFLQIINILSPGDYFAKRSAGLKLQPIICVKLIQGSMYGQVNVPQGIAIFQCKIIRKSLAWGHTFLFLGPTPKLVGDHILTQMIGCSLSQLRQDFFFGRSTFASVWTRTSQRDIPPACPWFGLINKNKYIRSKAI